MSRVDPKFQRINVWSEEPDSFNGATLDPVWHVAIEESRAYMSGNKWEPVAMVVTHAKTKREATKEAAAVLREWAKAMDVAAKMGDK
jgi:hypothetical protein